MFFFTRKKNKKANVVFYTTIQTCVLLLTPPCPDSTIPKLPSMKTMISFLVFQKKQAPNSHVKHFS
jgi:hypothetical protein